MDDILKKYFDGELAPEEEIRVQRWLVDHADEPETVRALDEIMEGMRKEDRELSSRAYAAVSAKLGLPRRRRFGNISRMALRIAACLALVVCGAAGYALLKPDREAEWLEAKVPCGEKRELVLSDGTRLHLNAGSRVTYPSEFTNGERRIFVEGEVFAEVTKNPDRPFIIASGDVDVKVFGTTFNFKAYDNTECVELLLLDGSVNMVFNRETEAKELSLRPGEMVQYDRRSGSIELRKFDPGMYRPFHDGGSIHFFNIRLSDIVSDLSRIFGRKIVLLDESLADTRYFAWFTNNENLEQILRSINADGRMKFVIKNEVIYILKK